MIVRTYARRSRGLARSHSDPDLLPSSASDAGDHIAAGDDDLLLPDPFLSQGSSSHAPILLSSQDSSPWSLDPFDLHSDEPPFPHLERESNGGRRKGRGLKRPAGGDGKSAKGKAAAATATATLMEAQEFGEMMEHVDEVNFALDGLRPRQPARVRRWSLQSLLSICESAQQRRLLRAQGMAKRIINAILGLNIDDSPSTVAAATLFFVLASDAQDDHLLDSPSCVQFLLKLLNPPTTDTVEDKAPTVGYKLLGLRKPDIASASSKGFDSSSTAIMTKVEEILLSCNEIKSRTANDDGKTRPELSAKWIALLTMEKACLSTVSFEDTADTVRKVGGSFKEKFRELGGLDAICDVVAACYSTMEKWLKQSSPSVLDTNDGTALECAVLLLKCLKIMENAAFLSKDNQDHLLGMTLNSEAGVLPLSFIAIIINFIRLLSAISLLPSSSSISKNEKSNCLSESLGGHSCSASGNQLKKGPRENRYGNSSRDHAGYCGIKRAPPMKSMDVHQKRQRLCSSPSELSVSGSEITTSDIDVYSFQSEGKCAPSVFQNGALSAANRQSQKDVTLFRKNYGKGSNGWISLKTIGSKVTFSGLARRSQVSEEMKVEQMEENYDPFAFDDDDMEPSKWELLAKKQKPSQTLQSSSANNVENGLELQVIKTNLEDSQISNEENHLSVESSFRSPTEEDSSLIEDCLLTAIKVLMNLTNDNPIGCQQIASCGGLGTLASLIINHFPTFNLRSPRNCQLKDSISSSQLSIEAVELNKKRLSDHELDFLVAILGLLVNLVEKDSQNRSWLVSAQVFVDQPGRLETREHHGVVIPLLCSIFLANQGTGENVEEERLLLCDGESSVLQGEREAEMMIIEAYAALLLAFLSTESGKTREAIAKCLPNQNLHALVPVLERFVAFHLTLNMISPETHSAVAEVIESCKEP